MRKITERQLKYANILMSKEFGELRKVFLKEEYNVDSSKDLTFEQAHEIISNLVPDNENREKYIGSQKEKLLKAIGQKTLL
jgi:thymidylate synthase